MKKYIYPIVWGIALLVVGLVISSLFGLYDTIPKLDKVYHTLGGVVLGWFFSVYLFSSTHSKEHVSLVKRFLIVIGLTCLVGVVWEFAERLASVYSPLYFPWLYPFFHGGDLDDTLLDLVADLSGGVLAFITLHLRRKI